MSGTRAGSPSEHHPAYLPLHRIGQAEARLPAALAAPFIAGISIGLWMLVLQAWRVLSGL